MRILISADLETREITVGGECFSKCDIARTQAVDVAMHS
jgi:hypothetical protein